VHLHLYHTVRRVGARRLGGIHFRQDDLESRVKGMRVGRQVWRKALTYFGRC
jgi:hypothetical protein